MLKDDFHENFKMSMFVCSGQELILFSFWVSLITKQIQNDNFFVCQSIKNCRLYVELNTH